jgi:hypothetical protein
MAMMMMMMMMIQQIVTVPSKKNMPSRKKGNVAPKSIMCVCIVLYWNHPKEPL